MHVSSGMSVLIVIVGVVADCYPVSRCQCCRVNTLGCGVLLMPYSRPVLGMTRATSHRSSQGREAGKRVGWQRRERESEAEREEGRGRKRGGGGGEKGPSLMSDELDLHTGSHCLGRASLSASRSL